MLCPICNEDEDTQEHLFKCKVVEEHYGRAYDYIYSDIFSNDADTLLGVARVVKELVDIREQILKPEGDEDDDEEQNPPDNPAVACWKRPGNEPRTEQ